MSDFDRIVNELSREFRKVRDKLIDLDEEAGEELLKKKLDVFWNDQPWYMQLFRKPIMKYMYKIAKSMNL